MNEIATTYLATYARGAEIEGGWKYAKALQQARLDFSAESLGRLDQLVAQIRERARPSSADLASAAGRNFAALVAFYVIEFVRRRTGAAIDWHDRISALRTLPDGVELPEGDAARLVAWAPDQRAVFWPLGWIEAQVLGQGARRAPSDYVAGLVAHLERDGQPAWWAGMEALGRIASWQMMTAAAGGSVLPTMQGARAPESFVTLASGLPGDDLREAVERGGRQLARNPDDAAWQVLAYDGFADLPRGRVDAVMVILSTYGSQPLRLKIAFPYRPAAGERRFAILEPTLREANVDAAKVALLDAAMRRGIASLAWPTGGTWEAWREFDAESSAASALRGAATPATARAAPAPAHPAGTTSPPELGGRLEPWRSKPRWKFW